MKKQNDEITIKGLVNIFLPKLWIIAMVSIFFAVVAGVFSAVQEETYTSRGKYMMNKISMTDPDAMIGLNSSEVDAMRIMIDSMQQMIDTDNFPKKVIEKLTETGAWTGELNVDELRNMMTVTKIGSETTCYYFSVTSSDPELSAVVATVAGELLIEEYEALHKYAITIGRIDDPTVATSPNSKNIVRNALIAFVAGLLLSMIAIFIISKFDVVIRSREMLEDNFDLPILGIIPRYESKE